MGCQVVVTGRATYTPLYSRHYRGINRGLSPKQAPTDTAGSPRNLPWTPLGGPQEPGIRNQDRISRKQDPESPTSSERIDGDRHRRTRGDSRGDGPDAPVGAAPGRPVHRRHPVVFTAPASNARGKSGAGQPGSPGRGGAIRPEFLGTSAGDLPGPARRDARGAGARPAFLHGKPQLFNVNYFCRLASIILAGSPPYPAPAAGPLRSGSWGR